MEKIFVPHKLQTALFCYSDEAAIEVTPSLSTISQPVEYQAKCIINGMLYLQDGIERQCNEKENKYLLHIRDSVGIPGH